MTYHELNRCLRYNSPVLVACKVPIEITAEGEKLPRCLLISSAIYCDMIHTQ